MTQNKIKYADYQKAIIFCKLLLRTHEQFDSEIKILINGLNLYEFEEDVIQKENERLKKELQELNEYLNLYEEEEEEEFESYWFLESERLKKENEILRKDLEQLSKFVYGKENKNNKNT
jgi:hypothetical protein